MQLIKNRNISVLIMLILIALITQLVFAISVSPLTPFEGYDSSMFKQIGNACLQGKTPYVDIFDHKGPFIFLIDALGLSLTSGRWGLFTLCVINCFLVLYTWYRTACCYSNGYKALLPVIVALLAYIGAMEEGNQTEDWCLLPNSYALYLLARNLVLKKECRWWEYLVLGIFAGIVLFIRANNMSILVCVVLFFTYQYICNKKWKETLVSYAVMACGGLFICACCIGYYYLRYGTTGLEQMIFGTFTFNFIYAGFSSYYDFLWSSMYNHIYFIGAAVLTVLAYFNNKTESGRLSVSVFLLLTFCFSFYVMGTASFRHYMMTVAPLFCFASCYAFRNEVKPYLLLIVSSILLFEAFFKHQMVYTVGGLRGAYREFYNEADNVISHIENNERNKIWNYNAEMTGVGILQHNRLVQANRVILNFHRDRAKVLADSENGKFEKVSPKYIIVDPSNSFVLPEDSIFVKKNYVLIKEIKLDFTSKNADEHKVVEILKHK